MALLLPTRRALVLPTVRQESNLQQSPTPYLQLPHTFGVSNRLSWRLIPCCQKDITPPSSRPKTKKTRHPKTSKPPPTTLAVTKRAFLVISQHSFLASGQLSVKAFDKASRMSLAKGLSRSYHEEGPPVGTRWAPKTASKNDYHRVVTCGNWLAFLSPKSYLAFWPTSSFVGRNTAQTIPKHPTTLLFVRTYSKPKDFSFVVCVFWSLGDFWGPSWYLFEAGSLQMSKRWLSSRRA